MNKLIITATLCAALPSCRSSAILSTRLVDPVGGDVGAVYYLPSAYLSLNFKVTQGEGVPNDDGDGLVFSYSLEPHIEVRTGPDISAPLLLQHNKSWWHEDRFDYALTPSGSIKSLNAESSDATLAVVEAIVGAAAGFAVGGGAGGGGFVPLEGSGGDDATKTPPDLADYVGDNVFKVAFPPLTDTDEASGRVFIVPPGSGPNDRGREIFPQADDHDRLLYSIELVAATEVLTELTSLRESVAAFDSSELPGIAYRPTQAFQLVLRIFLDGESVSTTKAAVQIPNYSPLVAIPVERGALVKSATSLTFENGALTQHSLNRPSSALELASAPLNVLRQAIKVPAEILRLRVDLDGAETERIGSQAKLEEAVLEQESKAFERRSAYEGALAAALSAKAAYEAEPEGDTKITLLTAFKLAVVEENRRAATAGVSPYFDLASIP